MNRLLKTFVRIDKVEQGQVLPLVLIMLVLGATIVAGSLTYAATTVKIGANSKTNQIQLYSADAGVQEAIWRIKTNYQNICDTLDIAGESLTYDPDPSNNKDINNEDLAITVENVYSGFWKIISIASSGGTATTVETYLFDYSIFFDYAAIAREEIRNKGTLVPADSYIEGWDYFPSISALRRYFGYGLSPSSQTVLNTGNIGDVIDVQNVRFTNGLELAGKGTLNLLSNIYIDGYLDMGNQDLNIQLNGHTIYIAANATIKNGTGWIDAKAKTVLFGKGCIIAEGNIVLYPKMDNSDDYILLMSIAGTVNLQPHADFYGSVVAGGYDQQSISIQMQPGSVVDATGDHTGLDFPLWGMSNWQSYRTAVVTGLLEKSEEKIAYSQTISAVGKEPFIWGDLTGTLPAGLNWNKDTATINGTPQEGTAGDYPVIVTVTDASGATASKVLTITIVPWPEIYANQWVAGDPYQLPSGKVGVYYAQDIGVYYGIRPFLWTPGAGFPTWATLDPTSGVIRGTPNQPGTYWFSVTVTSRQGLGGYDTKELKIIITAP